MKKEIAVLLAVIGSTYSFTFGANRNEMKAQILELSRATKRGLVATEDDKKKMTTLFEKLEKVNPTKKPLKTPLVDGVWILEYTTSDSILGRESIFPKVGPILQTIDTKTLSAENSEVVSYFGIKVPTKVTAELYPENDQLTKVQFKRFTLGPVSFDAPESFKGALDVTYLDTDLRLSRGDKGNLFVLTRATI